MAKKIIALRVSDAIHEGVRDLANASEESQSTILRRFIRDGLKQAREVAASGR